MPDLVLVGYLGKVQGDVMLVLRVSLLTALELGFGVVSPSACKFNGVSPVCRGVC